MQQLPLCLLARLRASCCTDPVSYGDTNINWTQIGGQPDFVSVTSAHPNVLRMVQALIGGPVKRPHRNRGTYVHFPREEIGGLGPHNDTMPAELFGMVYLSDVPPRSGGTSIWPTSPQRLYSCLESEHRCGFNPNEKYSPEFEAILEEVKPVEFVGGAGDVIFLCARPPPRCLTPADAVSLCHRHPAMIHSAGINSAVHGGGTLRIATVMEWQRARPPGKRTLWWTLNDSSRAVSRGPRDRVEYNTRARPGGFFAPAMDGREPADEAEDEVQLVWHHDAAEYWPYEPRPGDMWDRWAFEQAPDAAPEIVVEESWWERHKIDPPNTIFKIKDIAKLDDDGVWQIIDRAAAPAEAEAEAQARASE